MSRHLPAAIMLAVTMLVIGVMLVACTPALPTSSPSIEGTVSALQRTGVGSAASMLVTAPPGSELEYDVASVRTTTDTRFFTADGQPADISVLEDGARVEVWFDGPVAESYPVQAIAGSIRVTGTD